MKMGFEHYNLRRTTMRHHHKICGFYESTIWKALKKLGECSQMSTSGAIKALLNGELIIKHEKNQRWRLNNESGIVNFNVKSDLLDGEDWVTRMEESMRDGCRLIDYAKKILLSKQFETMLSNINLTVAVLPWEIFNNPSPTSKQIRVKAERLGLITPPIDLACLINEAFNKEEIYEMGFRKIVTMHEPFKFKDNRQHYLIDLTPDLPGYPTSSFHGGGENNYNWRENHYKGYGFAFVVS
ncbi:MAG: hypothetical protein WCT26_02395 [Candidatus Buchananbacteria bacterium]|jgi:hypothetical protein